MLQSVLYVAHELENERAVLLPDVSKIFLNHYLAANNDSSEHTTIESSEGTIKFSYERLLRQLTVHLYPHIASKCVHKKFGILIYKRGGDLLTSLSWTKKVISMNKMKMLSDYTSNGMSNKNYSKESRSFIQNFSHCHYRHSSVDLAC